MSRAVRAVIGLVCFIGIGICFGDGKVFVGGQGSTNLAVFDVVGDELFNPTTYYVSSGGIDIGLDKFEGMLFVSSEGSGVISRLNAWDGTRYDSVTIGSNMNITGLVFDHKRFLLYGTERNTNKLYIINLHDKKELVQTVELDNIDYICGLAINENTDTLYASEYYYSGAPIYEKIQAYSLHNNFAHLGEIDMEEPSVGIAYNNSKDILYSTAFNDGTPKLVKHNLSTGEIISNSLDYAGAGIAVDEESNFVFVSTAINDLELWDTQTWTSDPNFPNPTDPNYSASNNITNAAGVMFINDNDKEPNKPQGYSEILFTIDDGVNTEEPNEPNFVDCVGEPDDALTYTITVDPNGYDHTNVLVSVYLPRELYYEWFDMATFTEDPNYSTYSNVYTWFIGDLPDASGPVTFTLPVTITHHAEPGSIIRVTGTATHDLGYVRAIEESPVCCWYTGNILYVDITKNGNGTSWESAFNNLTQAIDAVNNHPCYGSQITQIWVAEGTYKPGDQVTDTFTIPDGISVYGGFDGTETNISERDYNKNKTILDGYIGEYEFGEDRNDKVVTMGDITLLDGFTIKGGYRGISAKNNGFSVKNSVIKENILFGISNDGGNFDVSWCILKTNGRDGIFSEGIGTSLEIENCKIYDNAWNGIYCEDSTPTIKNSVIYQNGTVDLDFYGVNLDNPSSGTLIRNCTIAHNAKEGIKHIGSYSPDVRNCILAYNNDEQRQLSNCSVSYSCVYDPNDPNTPTNNNINCNPGFAYDYGEFGYYHLATDSNCIDTGDPGLSYTGELDIDDEIRVQGNYVDMGADEYNPSCSDVFNAKDLNGDGIVNLIDFAPLSASWLSYDPNNPPCNEPNCLDGRSPENFDVRCDYQLDGSIDVNDLHAFAIEWLWQACWRNTTQPAEMMTIYSTSALSTESTLEEQSLLAGLTNEELVGKAVSITNILDFILKLANEKELKSKDAEELIEYLAEWLVDLQDEYYLRK